MKGKWNVSSGIKLLTIMWLTLLIVTVYEYVYVTDVEAMISIALLVVALFISGALLMYVKRMTKRK